MALAIAGTYMTFINTSGSTYVPGPFIIIGDDATVTVDGVAIKNASIGA